jgi:hypothetical protein
MWYFLRSCNKFLQIQASRKAQKADLFLLLGQLLWWTRRDTPHWKIFGKNGHIWAIRNSYFFSRFMNSQIFVTHLSYRFVTSTCEGPPCVLWRTSMRLTKDLHASCEGPPSVLRRTSMRPAKDLHASCEGPPSVLRRTSIRPAKDVSQNQCIRVVLYSGTLLDRVVTKTLTTNDWSNGMNCKYTWTCSNVSHKSLQTFLSDLL